MVRVNGSSVPHLNRPDAINLLLKSAPPGFPYLTHEVVFYVGGPVDNVLALVDPWFDRLSICYARAPVMDYRSALK